MNMPILRWSCQARADGWLIISVEAVLPQPNQPEALLCYQRPLSPFQLDERNHPLTAFRVLIQEMLDVLERGLSALRLRSFPRVGTGSTAD